MVPLRSWYSERNDREDRLIAPTVGDNHDQGRLIFSLKMELYSRSRRSDLNERS